MYTTIFEGVRFVEDIPPTARVIKSLRLEIGGILTSGQMKNLDDLKRSMAHHAKEAGGNAVVDFKYGQKSVGFWMSLIDRDDVHWYGEGKIALIR